MPEIFRMFGMKFFIYSLEHLPSIFMSGMQTELQVREDLSLESFFDFKRVLNYAKI